MTSYLDRLRAEGEGANPFFAMMGVRVDRMDGGAGELSVPVEPRFCNGEGWVQGGLYAALADEAIVLAIYQTLGADETIATITESTSFLRGVNGGSLRAVAFDIDANGIMNVKAKDLGTGKEQMITITASTKLEKNDIERMVKDAEKFAAEDASKKEKAEIMNQADTLLYSSEKTLSDAGDKITADQKDRISKDMEALREAQKTGEVSKIKSANDALTKTMNEVATVLYQQAQQQYQQQQQQAQQQAAQQQAQQGPQGGKDPNVVDADYEVVNDKK
jgi:uncharacterized protein (TIGR00369 family)